MHNLQILLKMVKASVNLILASSILWKLGKPSILGASIESIRFTCFYLHSKEHTGCLVSLQYRLAAFLHTIHHPNLPAGIACSFLISTCTCFLVLEPSSLVTFNGTDLSYTDLSSFCIISSSACFSSNSALVPRVFNCDMYLLVMRFYLESKRHTSSTMF